MNSSRRAGGRYRPSLGGLDAVVEGLAGADESVDLLVQAVEARSPGVQEFRAGLEVGKPRQGSAREPIDDSRTRVTHTYDWARLTDANRVERARATTADMLRASLDRLATIAESSHQQGSSIQPADQAERHVDLNGQGRKLARYSVGVRPVSSRKAALNAESEV